MFVFTFLLLPIGLLMGRQEGIKRNYHKSVFKMPTCSRCQSDELGVLDSYPERGEFRVAVHQRFADEYNVINY